MKLLNYLWPWKRRERIEEEKRQDVLFRAQIQEALLSQQNLLDAVALMKKTREDRVIESRHFRRNFPSDPLIRET